MTASFTDTAGRVWPLRLTLGLLPRLKSLGVDVSFATGSVDKVVEAAFRDPETVGRVLWLLVEPLAAQRGVTPEQLADAMDGPTLAAAVDAFAGAVVAFTHRPTVAPAVMDLYAATQARAEAAAAARVARLAADPGPPSTSSGSAGSSPASGAGATPAT